MHLVDDWSIIFPIVKNPTTKERILAAAEELMLKKSFHSVGLKEILDAVQVPKGSFYYYFDSKDQFGAEMMKHYIAEGSAIKRDHLLSPERGDDPLKRLFTYLEGSIDFVRDHPGQFPCLAIKLASEVADISEPMRKELVKGFKDWIGIYQQVLDEAVANKQLPKTVDTDSEAQLIQDTWAGSIQRSVTNRSPEPVRNAVEQLNSRIRSMTS